jgi:hypothetical protein
MADSLALARKIREGSPFLSTPAPRLRRYQENLFYETSALRWLGVRFGLGNLVLRQEQHPRLAADFGLNEADW